MDGGGASGLTGGSYALSATSGQHDAGGALTGGPYTLTGGFWGAASPAGGPEANLALTKTDTPDPVVGLQTLTYAIDVNNAGPGGAQRPHGHRHAPAGCDLSERDRHRLDLRGSWRPRHVHASEPGHRRRGRDNDRRDGAADGADALQPASVTAAESDLDPSNNADTEPAAVLAAPWTDLAIVKSDSGVPAEWGQPLAYTVIASNDGPTAVTGALVSDLFPASLSNVTWTCTATGGVLLPGGREREHRSRGEPPARWQRHIHGHGDRSPGNRIADRQHRDDRGAAGNP